MKDALIALFAATWAASLPAQATDIGVDFGSPGDPIPLRLNVGSEGWTHPDWSQYFNDIGVQYRRSDHWNNAYNPVRRRPDGGLWYDFAALDAATYDGTGGFSIKSYPTVCYSPACLTTEFLQDPMSFEQGSVRGSLTPAGTLLISGQMRLVTPVLNSNPGTFLSMVGNRADAALYEVDRRGNILARYPYQHDFFATAANHVVINTKDGYSILGPDRKEIAKGTGQVLQEVDGTSLLVASGTSRARILAQVDLKGATIQQWDGTYDGAVLLTPSGLLFYTKQELFLIDKNGKHSIQKFPDDTSPNAFLAANPKDTDDRFYIAVQTFQAGATGNRFQLSVYAFSPDGKVLWKSDPVPSDDVRGAVAAKNGVVVVATAKELLGFDPTGLIWKTSIRGGLDLQLLSTDSMETAVVRNYEDEIGEYDVRTGDALWRYGTIGDESYWMCTPPTDLDGWQDSIYHYVKHFNKDLGVGWDRWELWNEPTEHGYFWKAGGAGGKTGTAEEYAETLEATMKGVEAADPSITMDAFDGSDPAWLKTVISYCNDHQVRLDAVSWHGYRVADRAEDFDQEEQQDITQLKQTLATYTGATKPQISNSEWNIHPGHGDDQSQNYDSGYYRAAFQSEMIYLMGNAGVAFSSEFSMLSPLTWSCGWVCTTAKPVGGKAPDPGQQLYVLTPAYNAARLWAMLPQRQAPVTNDYAPVVGGNSSAHVTAIAGSDPEKGEYGLLVWNFSNQSTAARDQDVKLTFNFKDESGLLHMRHYMIDADHSTYTKDWDHQWLEATESVTKPASDLQEQTVTLKKDSLHAFFFTRDPLKANAGKAITVEAHHPLCFDGSLSTGMPAFYRWDLGVSGAPTFPEPSYGAPSSSHLFGVKPILAHGYDKPGTYTVTLRVSADGYHKETDTATTTVTVVPETTAPEAPQNLTTNCVRTDHQVFLQWDALNFARNPDVAGYFVYRKEATGDWKKITPTPVPPSTSYIDSGVTTGTAYAYRVTAVDSSGNEGPPSNEAVATFQPSRKGPQCPVRLTCALVGSDTVKLDWDNPSLRDAACVTGFNVYRRIAGSGDWQKLTAHSIWYKRYYDDVNNTGMAGKYEYYVTALDVFHNESLPSDSAAPAGN